MDVERHARRTTGLGRSFDIYCRDRARAARMDRLNAQVVRRGGLAFDIGAHVGDRTASFVRLGATVVALEPQPRAFRALRLLHGRQPGVTLLPWAAGRQAGKATLHLNTPNPTVATLEQGFIAAAEGAPNWQGQRWDDAVTVPVVTLDDLIARHGVPDFVKIDVEGHEADVLLGLGQPVTALSFEFTTIYRANAHACLDRLEALGRYAFNLSLGEDHRLRHDGWVTADVLRAELDALPDAANSGDVYARRV